MTEEMTMIALVRQATVYWFELLSKSPFESTSCQCRWECGEVLNKISYSRSNCFFPI